MRLFYFIYLLISPFLAFTQKATNLTCNYEQNPLAIGKSQPTLSWQIASSKKGAKQTAYRVIVASSEKALSENIGDIWDSQKTISDKSLYVSFQGKALQPYKKYFWKVKLWDETNKETEWSKTAFWQTGPMTDKDWSGKWISASKWFTPPVFRPTGLELTPKGGWADIDLGKRVAIDEIKLIPHDSLAFPAKFELWVSDTFNFFHHQVVATYDSAISKQRSFSLKQTQCRFIRLKVFSNNKNARSFVRQLEVYANGKNIALGAYTRENGTGWRNGHAPFLVDGMPSFKEGTECPTDACPSTAAPVFRKSFDLTNKANIKQAVVYYAALGMVDVTINGEKVTKDVLGPPFTDYSKRVMFSTYDVTPQLQMGKNVIGAILGNGFFSTPSLGFGQRHNGNGPPRFLLQLRIEFADGSVQVISTDNTWKWNKGFITMNDVWNGYAEDRTLLSPLWNKASFNDADWTNVADYPTLGGKLVPKQGTPIRINGLIMPDKVSGNVANFNNTLVGWPLLKLNGKAGQVITITGSGNGYKMAKMQFTLAQDGYTELSPNFIIQPGPTRLTVDGLTQPLDKNDIALQYVNADLNTNGEFSCSNKFLNQLYEVTLRTHRNYMFDIPADPNREKQGWTQDIQNMFSTAAYFTDVRAMYHRWWYDMYDSQDEQGYLGSVVPVVNRQVYDWNSPWWSGMIVFLPWEHYKYYGNKKILENSLEAMCKYVDLLGKIAAKGDGKNWNEYLYLTEMKDSIAAKEKMLQWNGAGDWNNPYTRTQNAVPTPMTTMPAWYYYATTVSKTATLLGKKDVAAKYTLIANDIKNRFNKKYFHPNTGLYGDSVNNQTAHVLPLAVGVVPEGLYDSTYQRLIDAIHARKDHIGTGFTTTNFLLQLLASKRESALANKIINQTDYPSWKTLIKNGVLQETWNGGGAQMPSCGGAIGTWLFQSVLGIQPDETQPGFKQFVLAPQPDFATGLTSAKGYFQSGYGKINVDWKCSNGKFIIDFEVPANSKAIVTLPSTNASATTESGNVITNSTFIQKLNSTNQTATYSVAAGKYHFETPFVKPE